MVQMTNLKQLRERVEAIEAIAQQRLNLKYNFEQAIAQIEPSNGKDGHDSEEYFNSNLTLFVKNGGIDVVDKYLLEREKKVLVGC